MGQVLHGSATTTEVVRRATQHGQESLRTLADRLIAESRDAAEEYAFIREDRAWRYSETFEQVVWHRVGVELRRRRGAVVYSNGRHQTGT
jgi:hypothetical protein